MYNKPRVFLSHSSLDKPFIEKLKEDLSKCNIDAWLDTDEIRDGKPWLKVIFEEGIPTCNSVLIYLTENSLNSKMVSREIDASIINQLSDNSIRVLPYASNEEIRSSLRIDLKSLQTRIWNEDNYLQILPSVVGEIWHSFLGTTVERAISSEKRDKLELELKIEKLKNKSESPFSKKENNEFEYLYRKLNIYIYVRESFFSKDGIRKYYEFSISLLKFFLRYMELGKEFFDLYEMNSTLDKWLPNIRVLEEDDDFDSLMNSRVSNIIDDPLIMELKTYGLLRSRVHNTDWADKNIKFTSKALKFKYWVEYNFQDFDLSNFATVSEQISESS